MPSGLLRHFVALVDEGSVSAAAKSLGVSASAVSRSLRRLEEETGLEFFRRESGRLLPTTNARDLLPAARIAVADLELVKTTARQFAHGEVGPVTIAATPAMTVWPLPRMLADTVARFPDVQVRIEETRSSADTTRTVESGRAELGLVPQVAVPPNLEGHTIGWHRTVLLCPAAWAAPDSTTLTSGRRLAWLGTFPLIADHPDHVWDDAVRDMRAEGARPQTVVTDAPLAALPALVAAGVGAALAVRELLPTTGHPGIRVVDLAAIATHAIHLVHRPGGLSPLAARLRGQAVRLHRRPPTDAGVSGGRAADVIEL